jgi:plasmid stabilization system protein ParE
MVKIALNLVLSNEAKKSLQAAYNYIKKDSFQNAEKVREKIVFAIKQLPHNPEKYNLDKYKLHNDGFYRAFEIYHYRISYFVSLTEVRIIRIRHTKMNPLNY